MARKRKKPSIADELLDELLSGEDALAAFQSGDLVQELKKALAERILNAEMDHHLDADEEQTSGWHCRDTDTPVSAMLPRSPLPAKSAYPTKPPSTWAPPITNPANARIAVIAINR